MSLPKLKRILTAPDEFLSNEQLKSLSMELLDLIPMEGIEGSSLDSEQIMEVVLRAAADVTSVNGVTTNTEDTPNREPVMDWLHTLEKESMLDAVNDILALMAMTVLDREQSRTVCLDFMETHSTEIQTTKTSSGGCKHATEPRSVIATAPRLSSHEESH